MNYLRWSFPLENKGLMITDIHLSTAFHNIMCQKEIINHFKHVYNFYDYERVKDFTNYLESKIKWEKEKKTWEYLGNVYLYWKPVDSIKLFSIRFYYCGADFFTLSEDSLMKDMGIDKWYDFEALSKIDYPDTDCSWIGHFDLENQLIPKNSDSSSVDWFVMEVKDNLIYTVNPN